MGKPGQLGSVGQDPDAHGIRKLRLQMEARSPPEGALSRFRARGPLGPSALVMLMIKNWQHRVLQSAKCSCSVLKHVLRCRLLMTHKSFCSGLHLKSHACMCQLAFPSQHVQPQCSQSKSRALLHALIDSLAAIEVTPQSSTQAAAHHDDC